jgi:hypothetical protein
VAFYPSLPCNSVRQGRSFKVTFTDIRTVSHILNLSSPPKFCPSWRARSVLSSYIVL